MNVDKWNLIINEEEQSISPNGNWGEVVSYAVTSNWGAIIATREDSDEKLILRFNGIYANLEYWHTDEGPVSSAKFPNRNVINNELVELLCCGCAIPIEVPAEFVLKKTDALNLFIQFLENDGILPNMLEELPHEVNQQFLPGMEEFEKEQEFINAVNWQFL